jgi:hypothetical protein
MKRRGCVRAAILACAFVCACDAKTDVGDAVEVAGAPGAVGSAGGSAGSSADGTGSTTSGVSFARDVFPTVLSTCAVAGCHELSTTSNHFTDYTTATSTYTRWVNGPAFDFCADVVDGGNGLFAMRTIVVPGHPEDSVLIERIASTRTEPCRDMHHPRMPPAPRPPLTAEQVATWTRWVAEGALQN